MTRTHDLLTTLERQLAVARAEGQRARAGADAAVAEAQRLRNENEELRAAPKPVPVHTEVSDRMAQILRLANEEAEQERNRARDDIARVQSETKAEIERLLAQTHAEAEREIEQARALARQELNSARETANREMTEARQTAEADLSRARAEAEITITSARTEADQLRLDSVRHAEHLIDDAQRRSGAVNGLAAQRLDALTATHSEALVRLTQIRDVLGQLIGADAAAGSLSAAVEAAMNNRGDGELRHEAPAADAVEGEIYDDALPNDVHEVIEVRTEYDQLRDRHQEVHNTGSINTASIRRQGAHTGSIPVHDLDDDLHIDPLDPLGQGTGEQQAVRTDMEIDLRDNRRPDVRLVTGGAQATPGGLH
ncbi:hypothetical protein KIH74_04060 [Kineosporia sp. J2-2]|uniref:Uncharacterized protein n=1 Tax=Kineosporia corallincola TaxID=2835133 RepID=A0ABS5TAI9_9ACTN|nr:hypothetical protein [Kineosporia corallincola]MBT0768082.1 hypothetical protein [Kineosporia corallincola]